MTSSAGMPESRLKIYSDLFEEVIERDRVFGSLLRKIKTAYDMLLVRGSEHGPSQPLKGGHGQSPGPSPGILGGVQQGACQNVWSQETSYGPASNEPTTRAEQSGEGWEMHRENRVLKDLVERLHLELEEAVKREHRWKQKVTKLKAREDPDDSRR